MPAWNGFLSGVCPSCWTD